MPSESQQDLSARCAAHLPPLPGIRLAVADSLDHVDDLYPVERQAIAKAVPKRVREFSTGRWLARELMTELGAEPGAIERGSKREPIWPSGIHGSITHAEELVVAGVARADACRSLGIDLEAWQRVTPELHGKLFNPVELELLTRLPDAGAGLLFSAKEAGYKATWPLIRRFIGFHEAEIDVDWDAGRFAIRYVGEHQQKRIMEQGEGFFVLAGPLVLSWFVIR